MNPRQRRGVLLIMVAGLGALVVFFTVVSYVGRVNAQIAPMVTVYRAAQDLPAYGELTARNVRAVEVPQRYVPKQAVRSQAQLIGRRVSFTVAAGTMLGTDMLLPRSELSQQEREIAIEVDAVTGIAGRIASGDFVDIYAVFGEDSSVGSSQVLVQNVRVVSVGGVQTRSRETGEGALAEKKLLPVTVAVSPRDALRVTYADAFAASVRLVGLPPGIQTQDRTDERRTVDGSTFGLPRGGRSP